MHSIAIHLRAMQFFAHAAHHNVSGNSFFGDHKFFGTTYETLTEQYDSVVERMLGLNIPVGQHKLVDEANKIYQNTMIETADDFEILLALEKELCDMIETTIKAGTQTQGTTNLLSNIADSSETRQYKLTRRLGQ